MDECINQNIEQGVTYLKGKTSRSLLYVDPLMSVYVCEYINRVYMQIDTYLYMCTTCVYAYMLVNIYEYVCV